MLRSMSFALFCPKGGEEQSSSPGPAAGNSSSASVGEGSVVLWQSAPAAAVLLLPGASQPLQMSLPSAPCRSRRRRDGSEPSCSSRLQCSHAIWTGQRSPWQVRAGIHSFVVHVAHGAPRPRRCCRLHSDHGFRSRRPPNPSGIRLQPGGDGRLAVFVLVGVLSWPAAVGDPR